jgi:hypothetical protein
VSEEFDRQTEIALGIFFIGILASNKARIVAFKATDKYDPSSATTNTFIKIMSLGN